ncbi:MAG: tRNA pseudouridine(55) synthase TruB [Clostridiales bacterium]|nr:tRNA pseudouridine(55) synthase TruB [Clostridiales bacterium]
MINGIVNVYKDSGFTSFDVVAKLRGVFRQKKIGHTGTLDPDATGVLPVALGSATRACDLLLDRDKEYEAVLLLGTVTDTQDVTGTVLGHGEVNVTDAQVRETMLSFVGEYMQVPPMYSALKVNGKKLCELAREGVTVEREARPVTVYDIKIIEMDLPRVRFSVSCSKGTYIRTLCDDIGKSLGCGGCMESLVRTRAAGFALDDALHIAEIEERVAAGDFSFVHSVDSLFVKYPSVRAKPEAEKLVANGNPIPENLAEEGEADLGQGEETVRLYDSGNHFIGLYAFEKGNKIYRPLKLFFDR